MNKFELYCMIYYVLDAEWDENKNEQLGKFLSSANPFLFKDIGSADPIVYEDFCKKVSDKITAADSYECARDYVQSLRKEEIYSAFLTVDENEWDKCLQDYLFREHKGKNLML